MSTEPFHVTDANFEETIKKNNVVFIDFWAGWCGPCRALAPIIQEVAKEYCGKAVIGKLDVDENPETAQRFGIMAIPTLLVMKDGKEVDRIVGALPKNQLEAKISSFF